MGKLIKVFAHDAGGLNALLPTLPGIMSAGHRVEMSLAGTCYTNREAGKLRFPAGVRVAGYICQEFETMNHDLTLVCASQSIEGSTLSAEVLGTANSPVACLIEDRYGSIVPTLKALAPRPGTRTVVLFSDRSAEQHAVQRLAGCSTGIRFLEFKAPGNPAYDATYALVNNTTAMAEKKQKLLEAIKARPAQDLIFLVAGQLSDTALQLIMISEMARILRIKERVKVIVRAHPRATDIDKRILEQYRAVTSLDWFVDPGKELAPTSDDCIPCADFIMSGFSTTNYVALIQNHPGVIFVGTPGLKEDLRVEKELDIPAEVSAGWAWHARDVDGLCRAVHGTLTRNVDLQDILRNREDRFLGTHDGHATERVTEEILSLLE